MPSLARCQWRVIPTAGAGPVDHPKTANAVPRTRQSNPQHHLIRSNFSQCGFQKSRFSWHLYLFSSRQFAEHPHKQFATSTVRHINSSPHQPFATSTVVQPQQLAKAAVPRRSNSSRRHFVAAADGPDDSPSLRSPQPRSTLNWPRVFGPNTRERRVLGQGLHQKPTKSSPPTPRRWKQRLNTLLGAMRFEFTQRSPRDFLKNEHQRIQSLIVPTGRNLPFDTRCLRNRGDRHSQNSIHQLVDDYRETVAKILRSPIPLKNILTYFSKKF